VRDLVDFSTPDGQALLFLKTRSNISTF